MKFALRLVFVLSLIIGLAGTQFLFAQGTDLGTIRGTVTDSTGAVVPGAKVTVTDMGTGSMRETATNSQGDYQIFGLSSGTYRVTVANAGMTTVQVNGIVVNGSAVASANATMKVASTTETIEVTTDVATINTENQTISDTISSNSVLELPRDSRNVYSFLYLNPNITQSGTDGSFKFLGAQSYGASFSLDGQRSNGGIFGEPTNSQPSLEAVGEINILSNDFTAEYAGIANIRVTTKRGSNGYHGSLFYNNKNSALAAWTLQDQLGKQEFTPSAFQSSFPNPYFNINDVGASIGGPIPGLKKTFFFAAFERNWTVTPVQLQSSTIPHPLLWGGDFSQVDPAKQPLI
ncbi:MAG TPA: carboxypeptidase-like regulatory domain-containing protein, partial [Terriglobales bacterium]